MKMTSSIFRIGGGISGCGIARDAAGRACVLSFCRNERLAAATSSLQPNCFTVACDILNIAELRLVREALVERESSFKPCLFLGPCALCSITKT